METYLTRITDYLLAQSWQIAVLTIAVAAAAFALRNRSAHIRYLLWLIVLAKCLLPPLYTIPLAILPRAEPGEPIVVSTPADISAADYEVADTAVVEPLEHASVSIEATSAPIVTDRATKKTVRDWLGIAWMTGVGVYLVMNLLRALRTNYWLWRKRQALSAKLQTDTKNLLSDYGFKSFPRIWLIEGISQPFVWGLLRGSIYLPADFVKVNNAERQRSILGHELSHILRFDAAVNILQVMGQAIFWFHPFVWWANRKIRQEREKCCDEMAIASLGAKAKEYSSAIVNILIAKYESTRPVPSLAVAGPVKNIEERIKTMLRPGKKFYKRPSLIAAITVFLVAFLTVPTTLVLTAQEEIEAPKLQTKSTQPLHEAATAGDIEKVKSLISKGADVNEKDLGGKTPLHCAAEKGYAEVARLLISQGAYVNATGRREMTSLHFAAMSGDKQTVELLLSKGADVNAKNRDGRTPLFEAMKSTAAGRKEVVELLAAKGAKVSAFHLAAYMGDMEKLKKFLQEGININTPGDCNITALHAAANSGKKDIVEFLISKGANVDAKDLSNLTPLYYAALHNYEDIADSLLAKGADVNAKGKDSYAYYTLLYFAIWDHNKDAIKLLISKGANVNAKDVYDYTPLFFAMWENDKDTVELLISKGADVNAEDKDGRTPYYCAAMDGREDMVKLLTAKGAAPPSPIHLAARAGDLAKVKSLIEEGADVNAKDKPGQTPLFWAVRADNSDVAKFLITKGADVNAKDKIGMTPLYFVIFHNGTNDMVELLIAKGADIDIKESYGMTPLHAACFRGRKDIAELLIAKGSNVNAKIPSGSPVGGMTPLLFAAKYGQRNVAELLISKGADIDGKNDGGMTPLLFAASWGHKDVVELLIAKGADMNAKDNKEQTALSLAKEQGHEEIAELLRKNGAKE
jgi:cytohesin